MTVQSGNVDISCPPGGSSCVLIVDANGNASYELTGARPDVTARSATLPIPENHGLRSTRVSVDQGMTVQRGNVDISCPRGGSSCVLIVDNNGNPSYDATGARPNVTPTRVNLTVPNNHGLLSTRIRVEGDDTIERGNVDISCPLGGPSCVLIVDANGNASYEQTGAQPAVMPTRETLTNNRNHGLASQRTTVSPGRSHPTGNMEFSCPAGGEDCVLVVQDDNTVAYEKTGGTPTANVRPGHGQVRSDAAPFFASGETSTLETTVTEPTNTLPALSAGIDRDLGREPRTTLSTNFFVKNIRTNDDRAYVITYVLQGREKDLILDRSECTRSECRVTVDGNHFFFWSWTDDVVDDDRRDGRGEFEYMASLNLTHTQGDNNYRNWFVFGVRSEELQEGHATYHGRFRARSYKTADPDRGERRNYRGTVRLVADFDTSQLDGRIFSISGTPTPNAWADELRYRELELSGRISSLQAQQAYQVAIGSPDPAFDRRIAGVESQLSELRSNPPSPPYELWPTSHIRLQNGNIVNGQFTATLSGEDDGNAPFDKSIRDFDGHVLGEFYGPNGEEVGGVITATRDLNGEENDRVLYGFLGNRKVGRLTDGADENALMQGVDRDFSLAPGTTDPLARANPTVKATADGFEITYEIDGGEQTVTVGEQDLGHNATRPTSYVVQPTGDSRFQLSSPATGSFTGPSLYEHFDINSWFHALYDPNNTRVITSSSYGYLVYGDRTEEMPTTGQATYTGELGAHEWPTDDAVFTQDPPVTHYKGDLGLTAIFGSGKVSGRITALKSRRGNQSNDMFSDVDGGLNVFNGDINGHGFSAFNLEGHGDLNGFRGSVEGAFYGPGAGEVGGVLWAENTRRNRLLTGWFGAKRDQ